MMAARYDPQSHRRTAHALHVLITLLVMGLLFLGISGALAGFVNPAASVFNPSPRTQVSEAWMRVRRPTLARGPDDHPAWLAVPGERYRVIDQESGWTLAIRDGDSPTRPVWLALDARVRLEQR
jgi:hypothetical protein